MSFPTISQWLNRNQNENQDSDPEFGFGVSSSVAISDASVPWYSFNPTSPGVDSGAQGTRNDPDETDAIATMRATTDEIGRSGRQTVDLYNSPNTQRMLDNQTARSRSADSWQDQRGRNNATFANQMERQNQATAFGQQSQMTRQQMGWAQDVALGGQPGDGRRSGGSTVSIEHNYSPFDTFMGNAAIIGNLGNYYNTQSNERVQNRQLDLQGQGMMMDDRYRNRALAVDSIIRANQRSLWSSPLEQIALNQARQPGMVR